MKKINLYLVAFFAVLGKSLVFSLGPCEVALLGLIMIAVGYDKYISLLLISKQSKEQMAPLEEKIARLEIKTNQLDNTLKLGTFKR